ncbi:MAG: hypothetical protein AAF495_17185 [Pseudomonadota bacterium]
MLLAGSPEHLLGHHQARAGVSTLASGEAVSMIGSGNLFKALALDGRASVSLSDGPSRLGISEDAHDFHRTAISWHFANGNELVGASLAHFALEYLGALPQMRLETVFKLFTCEQARGSSFLADLDEALSGQLANMKAAPEPWYSESNWIAECDKSFRQTLINAEQHGLGEVSTMLVGSPIFAAVH